MILFTRIRVMNVLDSFLNRSKLCAITSFVRKQQYSMLFYEEDCKPIQKSLAKLYRGNQKVIGDILLSMPTLNDVLSDHSNIQNINWKDIRQRVDNMGKGMYNNLLILDLCYHFKNYDAAISYIKYLKNNGYEVNLGLLGRYLHCYWDRKKPLTASEEEEIFSIVNDIKQTHEILDEITLKHIILALCMTSKWEDTLSTFKLLSDRSKSIQLCEAIAIAAFNNAQTRIAFEMIGSITYQQHIKDCTEMYKSHLNYCRKHRPETIALAVEQVFNIWESMDYVPYDTEVNVYIEVLTEQGWQVWRTNIKEQHCQNCSAPIDLLTFSSQEFADLQKAVMDKLFVGSDIYVSSTPRELNHFKQFLERNKYYDMIVDGLNVMYAAGRRSSQMLSVIDEFLSNNLKLLIIYRRHARKFYHKYIHNPNVLFYEVNDLSKDDIYILYAALMGGPDTTFLSGDLMRQHKYKLNDAILQRRFFQWQLAHHYQIVFTKSKSASIGQVHKPLTHRLGPGKTNGIWHIPITDRLHRTDPRYARWLCLVPPAKQHISMKKAHRYKVTANL